jgi:hypothetical protein
MVGGSVVLDRLPRLDGALPVFRGEIKKGLNNVPFRNSVIREPAPLQETRAP